MSSTLLLSLAVQRASQHDMLDASMFWVGLFMALTPIAVIGGILGYVWWNRRRKRQGAAQE